MRDALKSLFLGRVSATTSVLDCAVCGRSTEMSAVVRIRGAALHRDCLGYKERQLLREGRRL